MQIYAPLTSIFFWFCKKISISQQILANPRARIFASFTGVEGGPMGQEGYFQPKMIIEIL